MDNDCKKQLGFWSIDGTPAGRKTGCPVAEYLDDTDSDCYGYEHAYERDKFEALTCGSIKGMQFLADARGVTLNNINAKNLSIPKLLTFIPELVHGSASLIQDVNLDWVAVKLGEIIHGNKLKINKNIKETIGLRSSTKVLLLGYGPDQFIENLWTQRDWVFKKIAALKADLYTGIDYSVFLNHPHLERVLNVKRSLVTYDLLQQAGVPVIPHVYWSGEKDIERWHFGLIIILRLP